MREVQLLQDNQDNISLYVFRSEFSNNSHISRRILHKSIARIVLGEEYELWRFCLYGLLHLQGNVKRQYSFIFLNNVAPREAEFSAIITQALSLSKVTRCGPRRTLTIWTKSSRCTRITWYISLKSMPYVLLKSARLLQADRQISNFLLWMLYLNLTFHVKCLRMGLYRYEPAPCVRWRQSRCDFVVTSQPCVMKWLSAQALFQLETEMYIHHS
jgi:hypothetical protein